MLHRSMLLSPLVLSLFKQGSALQESQTLELCCKDSPISASKVPAHHLGFDPNGTSSAGLPGHLWRSSTLAAGLLLQASHLYQDLKLLIRLLTSVSLSHKNIKPIREGTLAASHSTFPHMLVRTVAAGSQ